MDVNQTQLLEIGLNVAGYLAGGGIMLLLVSIFKGDKNRSLTAAVAAPGQIREATTPATTDRPQNQLQFIDLSSGQQKVSQPASPALVGSNGRRNRTEVYELAKQMLSERKSDDEISNRLPLSNAELSLLKAGNNQDQGDQNV